MSDAIPAHHHLSTGSPRQQIRAAEQAVHEWLTPRLQTGNSVPVTHQELDRLKFLVECISRAAEGALLAADPGDSGEERVALPHQAQEATS